MSCPLTVWEYDLRQLAGQAVEKDLSFTRALPASSSSTISPASSSRSCNLPSAFSSSSRMSYPAPVSGKKMRCGEGGVSSFLGAMIKPNKMEARSKGNGIIPRTGRDVGISMSFCLLKRLWHRVRIV